MDEAAGATCKTTKTISSSEGSSQQKCDETSVERTVSATKQSGGVETTGGNGASGTVSSSVAQAQSLCAEGSKGKGQTVVQEIILPKRKGQKAVKCMPGRQRVLTLCSGDTYVLPSDDDYDTEALVSCEESCGCICGEPCSGVAGKIEGFSAIDSLNEVSKALDENCTYKCDGDAMTRHGSQCRKDDASNAAAMQIRLVTAMVAAAAWFANTIHERHEQS